MSFVPFPVYPAFIVLAPYFLYPSIPPLSHSSTVSLFIFPSACLHSSILPTYIYMFPSFSLPPPPICMHVCLYNIISLPSPRIPLFPDFSTLPCRICSANAPAFLLARPKPLRFLLLTILRQTSEFVTCCVRDQQKYSVCHHFE